MRYESKIGEIVLKDSTLEHITTRHPIVVENLGLIAAVLETPDFIFYSSQDKKVLLFYKFFAKLRKGKYIVVVVQSSFKQVITIYVTDKVKQGEEYEKNN